VQRYQVYRFCFKSTLFLKHDFTSSSFNDILIIS